MSKVADVISNIPDENLRKYLTAFAKALEEDLGINAVGKIEFQRFERTVEAGFDKVNKAITELAEAQKRTEERVDELAEAQKRTEERLTRLETAVAKLAEAQKRTEERLTRLETAVAKLAEAQKRTEERVTRLETAVAELAEAQKRTEESVNKLAKAVDRLDRKMMALGARWGLDSEQSFRNGMQMVVEDLGYKVENIVFPDEEGVVFGDKAQIEIDCVVKNGKTIAIEIKSSVNKGDLAAFRRKVDLYERIFEKKIDELLVISPFIDPRATVLAHKLDIKLATSEEGLDEI
ncbi:MAG: DUF3782 domain-containing protein [Thermotogae bacterium]|nr:DUF3782 domain-containing protein [Thermotogota bacterium]